MAEKECYGFKMYPSYYEVIRPLPDDQRLAMLDAIMDYAFMGTEPNGLSPVLNGYFTLIRPNIDKSVRQCNASVNNGGKGGRPPKQKEETQQKPGRKADRDMPNSSGPSPPAWRSSNGGKPIFKMFGRTRRTSRNVCGR